MEKVPSEIMISVTYLPTGATYYSLPVPVTLEQYVLTIEGLRQPAWLSIDRTEERKMYFSGEVLKQCVIEVEVTKFVG